MEIFTRNESDCGTLSDNQSANLSSSCWEKRSRGHFSTKDGTNWYLDSNKSQAKPDWVGIVSVYRDQGAITELNDRTGMFTASSSNGSVERFQAGIAPTSDEMRQALDQASKGNCDEVTGRRLSRALAVRQLEGVMELKKSMNETLDEKHSPYKFQAMVRRTKSGIGIDACLILTLNGEERSDIVKELRKNGVLSNYNYKNRVDECGFKMLLENDKSHWISIKPSEDNKDVRRLYDELFPVTKGP